jgi:hypothetical protein
MAAELNKIPGIGRRFTNQQLAVAIGRAVEGEADVARATQQLRRFLADKKINLTAEQEAKVFAAAFQDTRLAGKDLTPHLVKPPPPPQQIPPGVDPTAGWTWGQWNALPNRGTEKNPMRIILDRNGNQVRIYGKLQGSSDTPGHWEAMRNQAIRLADSGEYSEIHFQRGWGTVSGEVGARNDLLPDVLAVRRNGGIVDSWEAISKTDDPGVLRGRLRAGRKSLPKQRRGEINLLDPEPE